MNKHIAILTLILLGGSRLFAGYGWLMDFEEARAEAEARNVPILINFTGSDWCAPCIRLDNKVFSKEEFQNYSASNLVLFKADFPRNKPQSDTVKQQNRKLAEKYGIIGFPTILILSAEGDELGRTGYRAGGPEIYIEHLEKLTAGALDGVSVFYP